MSVKGNYRRSSVKKVSLEGLRDRCCERGVAGTSIGIDIAKLEMVVVVHWSDGTFESPWSGKNPSEISELTKLLWMMSETCGTLTEGMELTGIYGEAIRVALTEAKTAFGKGTAWPFKLASEQDQQIADQVRRLKALGLSLKEFSSSQYAGQLRITKRGSGLARKYLHFSLFRRTCG